MDSYFESTLPHSYKEVRNALDGWDHSTKMSPWLNSGCLSPRRLNATLTSFEEQYGRNDSSYWIYVELLWRDISSGWPAIKRSSAVHLQGTAKRRPLTCFFPDRYPDVVRLAAPLIRWSMPACISCSEPAICQTAADRSSPAVLSTS